MPTQHPTVEILRRLSSFQEIPTPQLQALSDQLGVHKANKGTRLLERGSDDASLLFLLEGTVELTAADGGKRLIRHQDASARNPIARLRPSRYSVVAASPISFLRIESELFDDIDSSLDHQSSLIGDTYQVDEDTVLDDLDVENRMTVQIYEDLNSNQLLLPSLPDIAIRVGEAVNHDFADAKRVARVIENDPAIAAKILKAANSALYASGKPVRSMPEAVVRIGLGNVHRLVITFALRELFRSNSPPLQKRMTQLWERSRQVTAIAHVLASHCSRLDREMALLAGLLHDIGSVAIIGYASNFPEVSENPQMLDDSLRRLKGQLGSMILTRWQLADELSNVAANAENWNRTHSGPCDYLDLVIVANLHAQSAEETDTELPPIESIPAYQQLGFGQRDDISSAEVLEEAQEEIRETLALLGG